MSTSVKPVLRIVIASKPADPAARGQWDSLLAECAEQLQFAFAGDPVGHGADQEDVLAWIHPMTVAPPVTPADFLNDYEHTYFIVLINEQLLADAAFLQWLGQAWEIIDGGPAESHRIVLAVPSEELSFKLRRSFPALGDNQILIISSLGEVSERAVILSIRVLNDSRQLVNQANPTCKFHFFISHAKLDGLPLAHSLKYLLQRYALNAFYDAEDLLPGRNWKKGLETGVANSLLIALRSDRYDERPWCQKEVLWALEYCRPIVWVDARTELTLRPSVIRLDCAPSARIFDGNLNRVLFLALRESLRVTLFQRLAQAMQQSGHLPDPAIYNTVILPWPPAQSAILRACDRLQAARKAGAKGDIILYPDPPLPRGDLEAASALVSQRVPGAHLLTPNDAFARGAKW